MTVLEAHACGKPVITSNVGGLKDLVVNGETGLLFKPENIQQLCYPKNSIKCYMMVTKLMKWDIGGEVS